MDYMIIGYTIYFILTAFIIFRVGWLFYQYGSVYLHDIFGAKPFLANALNRMLLIGYYLLNLGYTWLSISTWPTISNFAEMTVILTNRIGFICIILGIIHFFNMLWVKLLKNRLIHLYNY